MHVSLIFSSFKRNSFNAFFLFCFHFFSIIFCVIVVVGVFAPPANFVMITNDKYKTIFEKEKKYDCMVTFVVWCGGATVHVFTTIHFFPVLLLFPFLWKRKTTFFLHSCDVPACILNIIYYMLDSYLAVFIFLFSWRPVI